MEEIKPEETRKESRVSKPYWKQKSWAWERQGQGHQPIRKWKGNPSTNDTNPKPYVYNFLGKPNSKKNY